MTRLTATAIASPNIALIKYWGNLDSQLRLPVSSSISFNLAELNTETTVEWEPGLDTDEAWINGSRAEGPALARISLHLDHVRRLAGHSGHARVQSANNFPTGTGIASSASAFAALSLAASAALGLRLSERELSTLARLGSGSASRSIPGGYVAWYTAATHEASYAETIAPVDHWDLVDLIAIVSREHKQTGSTAGHDLAATSPLQAARIASAQARFETCQTALLARDFEALAAVVELDSNVMHSVMMTSTPPLFYWLPPTLNLMHRVRTWRAAGHSICYTLDAGPNVHCICTTSTADALESELRAMPGVLEVKRATPGGPARLKPDTA